MNHASASPVYREQQAGSLRPGDSLLLPDGRRSAEIHAVEVETDDFGAAALILVTLSGGGVLRVAAASTARILHPADLPADGPADMPGDMPADPPDPQLAGDAVAAAPAAATDNPGAESGGIAAAARAVVVPPLPAVPPAASGPSEAELALIPVPAGTPESVVAAAAEAHPGLPGVQLLGERLGKGINTKSGSCLKDLSDLANELFIDGRDAENALAVADLLNVLPFDGNPGRWASVEATLALSSHICRGLGQTERAGVYDQLLRIPDTTETDPFKARINAKVRQRSLNEPNLYDKEIFRAIDNSTHDAEREWRRLRLQALLFLRAHGGSETIDGPELERRIGNELDSVRT